MPRTRSRFAVALALVVTACASAPLSNASAQGVSQATCPGTFTVLHDDSIGSLSVPAGQYVITVLNSSTLSCADAFHLFAEFLEDFDGRLTPPWRLNAATATFTRGNSSTGFRVAQSSPTPPAPPTPPSSRVCPAYFTVLHNDHIGSFSIPKGRYRITLLSVGRITCSQASNYLAQFLQDFDGVLPAPWLVDPTTGSFMRGSRFVGFRIKPWSGSTTGGGGGGKGTAKCPGTFRVLHNDRIGNLALPRGPYYVSAFGSVSCKQASAQFTQFLDNDYTGALPRPWVLNGQTGQFTRGRSNNGFRVKPAG